VSQPSDGGGARGARTATWIFGSVLVVILAVVGYVAYGLSDSGQRESAAQARAFAQQAARELPALATDGTLSDQQINDEMRRTQSVVRRITRGADSIVVLAVVEGRAPGPLAGTVETDICVQYTIALPVQPDSKIDMRELPSCPR